MFNGIGASRRAQSKDDIFREETTDPLVADAPNFYRWKSGPATARRLIASFTPAIVLAGRVRGSSVRSRRPRIRVTIRQQTRAGIRRDRRSVTLSVGKS